MAKKGKTRAGGKFTGSHTTVTDKAAPVIDFVHGLKAVSKISIGVISPLGSRNGNKIKLLKLDTS